MNRQQLEMSLEGPVAFRPMIRRRRRLTRARWWFEQMRQVVDRALDLKPAPPARPEQVFMQLSHARGRN